MRERQRTLRRWLLGAVLLLLGLGVTSCILPENYSDWQWQQYSPEWRPLPGDPDR